MDWYVYSSMRYGIVHVFVIIDVDVNKWMAKHFKVG